MGVLKEIERDAKRVKKIKAGVNRCRDHLGKWKTMSMQSYAYYGNVQWDSEDIGIMQIAKKAPITFNRVTRTISAVMGIEAANRQAVMYYPRQVGDSGVSELLTGAADWARETCDAEDEESQAFKDTLICGLGWTETRLDYECDRDGNIVVERVDPLDMGYDINARKDNLDDATYFYRERRFTKEQFREKFPEKADEIISSGSNGNIYDDTITPHDATKENAYKQNNATDSQNDNRHYRVIQWQDYESKPYWLAIDLEGNMIELEKYDKKMDALYARKPIRLTKRVYKQTFIIGDTLLEEHDMPVDGFTFRPMTGLYNRNNNYWFGLVELMKDPQMWANKWLTEALFILRTNASGGCLYEEGTFTNPSKAMEDWAKPNSMIPVNPGGAARITTKPGMGGYPDGMMNLLQFAIGGIQDVTGVNVEMLGMADRNQPMGLEKQRKEAGTGILSPFFNALRRYHKEQGRVLAEFIIHYISDGRLVRIAGEQGAQYVPLLKDDLTFKYDIIVDEAVTNPDIKQKVFELIAPMIPGLMQSGIPIPPELLDYFPIPAALTEAWKKMLAPKEPSPEEMQAQQQAEQEAKMKEEMMTEMQMKLITSEANYKDSQAQLNRAKVGTEHANAESKQAETFGAVSGKDEQRRDEAFLKEQARRDIAAELEERRKLIKAGMAA